MELNWAQRVGHPEDMLDALGESTGDYYVLYDIQDDLARFSSNMVQTDGLGVLQGTRCTLSEWLTHVDERDQEGLMAAISRVCRGESREYNLNYRVVTGDGHSVWVNSRGKLHPALDGSGDYVMGRLTRKRLSGRMGPFRSKELKREIRQMLQSLRPGYLLLVGMDDFKAVNLKNGWEFGDALLQEVKGILKDQVGGGVRVYRISGDWFAVNLPGRTRGEIEGLFEGIQERLAGRCTVSGGAASYTDGPVRDESTLLQYAEVALDHAKAHGKNRLSFFLPEDYEERLRMLQLREDLQTSVSGGFSGFSLVYQPQVRTGSYELYGAEALLRYVSPRLGPVASQELIPTLEQSGLICPVGLWALEQALRCCAKWREQVPGFRVSVNMSYVQLSQPTIQEDVLEAVSRSGLPGEALTIEVTESMQLMDYPYLNDIFRSWKREGVEISVDDFGTGYSSLSRLKDMEVDEIKIDRCFVQDIQKSVYNYRLLSNIVELADSCRIRVCCEGVESREELEVLEELHPALLQGFLFSTPVSSPTFQAMYVQTPQPLLRWQGEGGELPSLGEHPGAAPEEAAQLILNEENDIFYLSDVETYELYYLNPAGQRLFGVKDYQGKKCYKVLHGNHGPCDFCTNACLRQDTFFVWEKENQYCARRFLLKDKLVTYRGRKVRMEVALDITDARYIRPSSGRCRDYLQETPVGAQTPSHLRQGQDL